MQSALQLFSQEMPFASFWLLLVCTARSCEQNIAKNLFDDGANISSHLEVSNLVACLAIEGNFGFMDIENGAPCKHFCFFSPRIFIFILDLLALQSVVHAEKFPSKTLRKQVIFS